MNDQSFTITHFVMVCMILLKISNEPSSQNIVLIQYFTFIMYCHRANSIVHFKYEKPLKQIIHIAMMLLESQDTTVVIVIKDSD